MNGVLWEGEAVLVQHRGRGRDIDHPVVADPYVAGMAVQYATKASSG